MNGPLRKAILASIANGNVTGRAIGDDLYGALYSRREIGDEVEAMSEDGSLIATKKLHQSARYAVGKPVFPDDSAAIAHLSDFGELGQSVLRLCEKRKVSPGDILGSPKKDIGRIRGLIISQLVGTHAQIAACLRVSEQTVRVYQPDRF